MYRILPIFVSTVCGASCLLVVSALPLIAHQQMTRAQKVETTIYANPSDASQSSLIDTHQSH